MTSDWTNCRGNGGGAEENPSAAAQRRERVWPVAIVAMQVSGRGGR
jgi:hypothetical protein